jgi:hypothetical protein
MTPPRSRSAGESRLWHIVFVVAYWLIRLLDPLIRAAWRARLPGVERSVDLVVAGRASGRVRHTLLTLLTADDRWYVGHPNGDSGWTRNLEAAAGADVLMADGVRHPVMAIRLRDGSERDGVVALTRIQQPFPANLLYGLAQHHIRAVGAYFRLERR